MTLATVIVYGRYWYDFLTLAVIVAFFLSEMVMLFRNSVLGWAMTLKCVTLSAVFGWALANPPPVLSPEVVTLQIVVIRCWLISVLVLVISILAWMRYHQLTVIVGREGVSSTIALTTERQDIREGAQNTRETVQNVREREQDVREGIDPSIVITAGQDVREGEQNTREREQNIREREQERRGDGT